MAIAAHNRQMSTCERKWCFLVGNQRERRWLEALDCVALVALVLPGCASELRLVLIVMAVEAAGELDLVQRFLPLGNVASSALYFGMLALQRILSRSVRLHIKFRRFPSVDVVAGRALACIRPLEKLSVMCVLVTVGALRELERLLEIAIAVAGSAFDAAVLTLERILGFGMVEILLKALGDALPA
jgi:hypothetical protein